MDNPEIKKIIEEFIFNYEKNGSKIYLEELMENLSSFSNRFIIDFNDLRNFNKDLAQQIISDKKLIDTLTYFIYEIHSIKYELKDGKYLRTNTLSEYGNKVSFNYFYLKFKNFPEHAGEYKKEYIINDKRLSDLLYEFITSYKKNGKYIYLDQLLYNIKFRNKTFIIDAEDLQQFNLKLAQLIIADKDALEEAKKTLYLAHCSKWVQKNDKYEDSILSSGYCDQVKESDFELVFPNQALSVTIRDIGTSINKVNTIIRLKGIVVSKSDVKLQLIRGYYIHADPSCMAEFDFPDENSPIILDIHPRSCPVCNKSKNIVLIPERSEFAAWQKIIIQESAEDLERGETPRQISIELSDNLVDSVKLGDKIEVSGSLQIKNKLNVINNKLVTDKFIRAVNIKQLETNNYSVKISEEDIKKIKELSQREDIIELIINSIAPSIYDMRMEKEAIALSLFSPKSIENIDGTLERGNIHSLIIGDPGLAKSQLAIFVSKLMPRAGYVDCGNASGVGLTAAANRDEDLGEWRIDAGALALSDNSVVVLDEFDKLSRDDIEKLKIPLEQQIITVEKAGKSATLQSRVSVIAISNPKFRRWVKDRPIEDNIQFPPDVLSRFDIIIIEKDEINEEKDKKFLEYLSKARDNSLDIEYVDLDLFRKYIMFARENIDPKLSPEAEKLINEFYIEARKKTNETVLQFTPRQLKALKRMSLAYAKMRLSDKAEVKDAERAIQFMQKMLERLNIDVETGLSQESFDKAMRIYDLIKSLTSSPIKNYRATLGDIIENAKDNFHINEDEIMRILFYLWKTGKIKKVNNNEYIPA